MRYGETVVGSGPSPVLFLPGAGLPGVEGLSIAEAMAPLATTHMLDLPGSGRSDPVGGRVDWHGIAAWLCAYLDARGIERVTAIGHSLGAMCLLALADRHPERVRRLVLLDGGHRNLPRFPVREMGPVALLTPAVSALHAAFGPAVLRPFLGATGRGPGRRTGADPQARARAWARAHGCEASAGYVERMFQENIEFGADAFAVALALYRAPVARRFLALRVPSLLVYAAWPDWPARAAQAARAVARIRARRPDIELVRAEGGHYVHWVQPERVHAAIARILQSP